MTKAFSIAELVIVVAIIGIMAALVMPCFQGQAVEAKEAATKDNLRMLRGAIELYAANHGGVAPGYEGDDASGSPDAPHFLNQMVVEENYMRQMPENPFNNFKTVLVIANDASFPAAASGQHGWIYQPVTKTIRLDWPGRDRNGVSYIDY